MEDKDKKIKMIDISDDDADIRNNLIASGGINKELTTDNDNTMIENSKLELNRQRDAEGIFRRIQQIRMIITEKRSLVEINARAEQLNRKFLDFKNNYAVGADDSAIRHFQEVEFSYEDIVVEIQIYKSKNEEQIRHNTSDTQKGEELLEHESALWKGLKKVTLPTFSGDRVQYEQWAAAFEAIIDRAPISPEHKLLHLKTYLAGEAADVVKNLGHSASAYEVAKERLGRKYGGARRRTALLLEEVENFPNVRPNNAQDLAKFADILDVLSVNLAESNMTTELGAGLLYIKLQKKLPKNKLSAYHRWLFEKKIEGNVVQLRSWIVQEQVFDTIADETTRGLLSGNPKKLADTFHAKSNNKVCKICEEPHSIKDCPIFLDMNVDERSEKAQILKLCFGCLNSGHIKRDCRIQTKCQICDKAHHTLFHGRSNPPANFHLGDLDNSRISLRTIPIKISFGEKVILTNALLDDGSTCSFVNTEIVHILGIPKLNQQSLRVGVLNGSSEKFNSYNVKLEISSMNDEKIADMEAMTIQNVTGSLRPIDWAAESKKFSHLQGIPFDRPNKGNISVLIGLDNVYLHQSLQEIYGNKSEPIARLTPLGWTAVGRTTVGGDTKTSTRFINTFFHNKQDIQNIENKLLSFWEIEEVGSYDQGKMCISDREINDKTKNSIRYFNKNNRYQVSIPWNENKPKLGNNYKMAYQRLKNTEQKLAKNVNLKKRYSDIIDSYEKKGYIRKIQNKAEARWFLPHFPIIREDKQTSKIRIVFDAAATFNGISLNDTIHSGPKLQNDIIDLLIRFRMRAIAITMDLQEMYLQIQLDIQDRPFHAFLWRNCEQDIHPNVYMFDRLIFGSTASPYLAQLVSQENAMRFKGQFPRAAETVFNGTYMDDGIDSVDTVKEGKQLYVQLKNLWAKCGMSTHKWLTNSLELQEMIPKEEWGSQKEGGALSKTLGVAWDHSLDILTFNKFELESPDLFTKREFLRKMAQVFDPLGFLGPYVLGAKLLIQAMWLLKIPWDEPISGEIQTKMKEWIEGLKFISAFKVPRYLHCQSAAKLALHAFADASEEAYGVVIYLRATFNESRTCNLLISKTRVAPLTALSIPRLELLAAVKTCEVAEKVCNTLKIELSEVTFWTDSKDVIGWLRNRSRIFKSFVAHKIGKIHSKTQSNQWKYVPSKQNPANLTTHPSTVHELVQQDVWFHGPEYLLKDEEFWPDQNSVNITSDKLKEKRNECFMCNSPNATQGYPRGTSQTEKIYHEEKLCESLNFFNEIRGSVRQYSSWIKTLRVQAWSLRFLHNSRNEEKIKGELTVDELYDARVKIIKETQEEAFPEEHKALSHGIPLKSTSKLLALTPKFDEFNIIRCDSRISKAEYLPYDTRYPIILPRKHQITALIVQHFHELVDHQGTNTTLARLSSKYWIIAAREEIRDCEKDCVECKRRKVKASTQIMSPLPEKRLSESLRAFTKVGIDYAGPYKVIVGRGKTRHLRYLCVFTCFSTRAIHLEIAFSLDTSSFLNAFWRFCNRRGYPQHVTTDNGTQFVGAEKELKELVSKFDKERIIRETSIKEVKWDFNPPRTPHSGGVFEIMVRAAKRSLKKQLSSADVTDEELLTVITGAESLINSRPLTYQSADSRDVIPLTPSHFLIGELGRDVAPDVEFTSNHPLKRWKRVQEILKHFWKRWISEILPGLNPRSKWRKIERDFQVNDVVMVLSVHNERGTWPLGRIIEVMPGDDGHVRTVKVLVNGKTYVRGINSISLVLPSNEISC